MKSIFTRSITIFFLLAITISAPILAKGIEKSGALRFGGNWPKSYDQLGTLTNGDGSVDLGVIADNIVGMGVELNFQWNMTSSDSVDTLSGTRKYIKKSEENYLLFPVSFYLSLDPLQNLIVHPIFRISYGLNIFNYTSNSLQPDDTIAGVTIRKLKESSPGANGIYLGGILKLSADAMYDFSENVSVFGGISYQLSTPAKSDVQNSYEYKATLDAFGIHCGLRFKM